MTLQFTLVGCVSDALLGVRGCLIPAMYLTPSLVAVLWCCAVVLYSYHTGLCVVQLFITC